MSDLTYRTGHKEYIFVLLRKEKKPTLDNSRYINVTVHLKSNSDESGKLVTEEGNQLNSLSPAETPAAHPWQHTLIPVSTHFLQLKDFWTRGGASVI